MDSGFVRTDLLAVAASLSLVLVLVLSMGNTTRTATESAACQNNFKQLSQAWLKHSADNPLLVGNPGGGAAMTGNPTREDAWAFGWLTWDGASDNTNTAKLQTVTFAPYIGSDVSVFRCPSDRFVTETQRGRGWRSRVRSYSMNGHIRPVGDGPFASGYRVFTRESDFQFPSHTFVFTDEHPDSINDPWFYAYPDGSRIVDVPASFHNRGAGFSFADGHVELHRWRGPQFVKPVRFSFSFGSGTNDVDLLWLGQRASQRR
jgi:prepilin-type processing-associated H-X9-DG protein